MCNFHQIKQSTNYQLHVCSSSILSGPGEYNYQEKLRIGGENGGLICSHDTRFKTVPKTPLGPGTYKVLLITND